MHGVWKRLYLLFGLRCILVHCGLQNHGIPNADICYCSVGGGGGGVAFISICGSAVSRGRARITELLVSLLEVLLWEHEIGCAHINTGLQVSCCLL